MFIDIHSHHHALSNEQWVIKNLYKYFEQVESQGKYSIGLHPWYIDEVSWHIEFDKLQKFETNNFVVAIGECGLDKNCKTDFLLQKKIFTAHVILSNNLNKPLIIHCVNAYQEIKQILKANKINVPVIFHGFNRNEHIAKALIKEGYFLSFGKALLKEHIKILVRKIALENIFFETDNDTITIEEIYSMTERILSVDTETLQLQIKKNDIRIFVDGLF